MAEGTEDSVEKTWGYEYISNPEIKRAELELDEEQYPDGVWNFRVCRYLGGSCDIYSNQVSVELN